MFICPVCRKEFASEEAVARHLNKCWREEHPFQPSKAAPQSPDICTREANEDVLNFFASLKRG